MNNEEVVKFFNHKECLIKQKEKLEKALLKAKIDFERCERALNIVNGVSFIYKGIAISEHYDSWSSVAAPEGCSRPRLGYIYLNQHNKITWGIRIKHGSYFGDEEWLGMFWPNKESAKQAVLDFIVSGNKPQPG